MEHFTKELVEATFLWARKRLTNSSDAEELTQIILCEAVAAFRSAKKHGRAITAFYPWYWKAAENQLKIFLRLKYKTAIPLDGMDDTLISPDDTMDELIRAEEIREISYAVSRLSKLQREMIIDYYLREMPTKDIAASHGIPESTVRRRLFDAKADLKRSIENMEITGRSSYAPAMLELIGSGSAPDYWDEIKEILATQIFVICRKTPRTIREISDEIAVAPVYFEEKLDYLVRNGFVKETSNGKYLTDFVILPKQVWVDFGYECVEVYRGIGKEIRDILLGLEERIRGFDFIGNDLPTGRLMWLGYIAAASKLSDVMTCEFGKMSGVPVGNRKNYRCMGIVTFPDERIVYKPCEETIGWSNNHFHFRTSDYRQITFANLFESEPFDDPGRDGVLDLENISLFMRIAKNPHTSLSDIDAEMAAELIAKGFLEKRDGLRPTLPVMSYHVMGNIEELIRESVSGLSSVYVGRIAQLGEKMILPHIRKDLYEEYVNFVMRNAFFPLGSILKWAMYDSPDESGLEIPTDYLRSSAATAVYYTE